MNGWTGTVGAAYIIVTVWAGVVGAGEYGGGEGTAETPYEIWDANDLNEIGLHAEDWGRHFVLMDDIDLGGYDGKEGRPTFNVIGDYRGSQHSENRAFTGVFDGNDKKILNLRLSDETCESLGFFGYVGKAYGQPAVVKNLTFVSPRVESSEGRRVGVVAGVVAHCYFEKCKVIDGSVSGNDYTGGFLGYGDGQHLNFCSFEGVVTGADYVGGLTGYSSGEVKNSFAVATVKGHNYVGGLAGNTMYATFFYSFSDNDGNPT